MTDQEIFDFVLQAIRTQGKASMAGGTCAYRGTNRTKCAAGHLISDEEYDPNMEGSGVNWCAERWKLINITEENKLFVRRLQLAHDNSSYYPENFIEYFNKDMKRIATEYGLTYHD